MTKILLIEDILDNAELVRRALSKSGYEIVHALDALGGFAPFRVVRGARIAVRVHGSGKRKCRSECE